MTTTRRSFFASLAALVVAPKVLKTIPTGTENYVRDVLDIPWVTEHQTRMWAAIEIGRKVTFFPAAHLAGLRTNDWVDFYAIPDHPHLEAARRIAMLRHVRQHELAANRFVS